MRPFPEEGEEVAWLCGPRVFQNPPKAAKVVAFSHRGTENTEEMSVFSSGYSVFSVALCESLFEHAKLLALRPKICLIFPRSGV